MSSVEARASASSTVHCSNTARQASLRLALCRRRQAVIARTFGISPAHRRYTSGIQAFFCSGVAISARANPVVASATNRLSATVILNIIVPRHTAVRDPVVADFMTLPPGHADAATAPFGQQLRERISAKCDLPHL